ncbi:MAG TPA: haloacid dehalogenase type II [Bryobacteraceae bacterium]
MTRRQMAKTVGISALTALKGAPQSSPGSLASIRALLFDVFGTVVDWRGSIIAEGRAWQKSKRLAVDWGRFADRWRAGYMPSMDKVRKGELPWTNLDRLNRALLEDLLNEFHIAGLSYEEKDHWNRVWHRLMPWPDSVAGLVRLKRKFTIAPLSNGNVALLTDMAKHADLPWDLILSAELSRHYKPDPEAYLKSVELLELEPHQVMMCAAHSLDLAAARKCGLRTGFIYRPDEFGPGGKPDQARPGDFDVISTGIPDLAVQLGT